MGNNSTSLSDEITLQSFARKVLDFLKILKVNIPMEQQEWRTKAKSAEDSIEELVALLENSEEIAVEYLRDEVAGIRKEVINWDDYQDDPEE